MKKLMYITVGSLAVFFLSAVFFSSQAKIISSESQPVFVDADEIIEEDLFIAGSEVTINGTVEGDVYAAGGIVRINGTVTGDVLAAGGNIDISGMIGDDVRVAGGNITIHDAQIGDSLNTFGGNIHIDNRTQINGGLVIGGGFVTTDAEITRGITGGAGGITINGSVGKDVDVGVGTLTIQNDAQIEGNVTYYSESEALVSNNASVDGKLKRMQPTTPGKDVDVNVPGLVKVGTGIFAGVRVGMYLAALLVGIFLLRLFPKATDQVAKNIKQNPWKSLGMGLVVLFVTPPTIILLFVTLIGIPLGGILAALFSLEIYLAKIFAGVLLGYWLQDVLKNQKMNKYLSLALGLAIYFILTAIPILGFFVSTAALLFGLGAAFSYKLEFLRNK